MVYREAFPGVDLRYDVLSDGFKETLVLASADVPAGYRFILTPPKDRPMRVEEQADGSWAFFMASYPGPVFQLGAPYAFDSASPLESNPPDRDNASIKVTKVGESFAIDLDIDPKWLHDPARTFPVFLDPTTWSTSDEDATFVASCATCTPGTWERLYMGTNDSNVYRAALQWNLNGVPEGATITDARLKLYWDGYCMTVTAGKCGQTTHQIDTHMMTKPWSTLSTTQELAFEQTPVSSYTLDPATAAHWMSWDLTRTMKKWVWGTEPNFGLLLKRASEPLGKSGPALPGRRFTDSTVRPRFEVTYDDSAQLLPPDTLHSDGAELEWTRYPSGSTVAFEKYEVHRSLTSNFTPSSSTLLATIRDASVTSYRDTTAAPGKSFTYKVVTNGASSYEQTVTLPADGKASKLLRPGPADGKATVLSAEHGSCYNYGTTRSMHVGHSTIDVWRPLVGFDLGEVPAKSTIENATVSLWHGGDWNSGSSGSTVNVHRVTRAWREGTGYASCSGDGATWSEADGDVSWTNVGGDFDPTIAASHSSAQSEKPTWDEFNVSSLVQQWVNGTVPNLGMLFKIPDDTALTPPATNTLYWSDDYAPSPGLRPKLAITYADGSRAIAPTVSIASPAADAKVSGSSVTLAATASDDRRVEKVEFLVDGTVVGTDTASPYEATWNSTTVANGAHNFTARATDDAGNVRTSAAVSATVQNSAPPTTSLKSPKDNSTVSGTVTVSADAGDDLAVEKVEFYFDSIRIGEDAAAPYSLSWNTLDASQPAYDGGHVLTSKAYDNHGQVTTSAARNVTVANTSGTKYAASLTAATAVPPSMTYDPAKTTQDKYPVSITITNKSSTTWAATDVVLRYRWYAPDGTADAISSDVSLGSDVAAGGSGTKTVDVFPPALPDGVDKAQYKLRFDLFDKPTSSWFAAKGNQPLDNPIIVNKAITAEALGLERYYHYDGEELGAGMAHLANVANGNSLLRWTPFLSPGRGLSTVLDLTYNSLEDRSESPVGNNFSLAISSLTRLGLPIDIHPNKADEIAGRSNKWIAFTDGDGTTHRFEGKTASDGTTYWEEPAGVHLYLRQYSTTDPARKWALTRPDRVTFLYNDLGFPTSVEDKNGNRIDFTLEDVPPGEDPGAVKKRITTITDAAGVTATTQADKDRRTFKIDYYSKDEVKKPQIRGRIQSIRDHSGSVLYFEYYEDGNLLRITQASALDATGRLIPNAGRKADGGALPDRSFVFTYTTSDGSGPAITDAAARVNPDPKTSNQSTRLYSVRDPRGRESTFTYYGPTSGLDRWKLKSRTNRTGNVTSFTYDMTNRVTTVTAPLSRTTKYAYDTEGKVTSITNPKSEMTKVAWSADRHLTKVTEPTGAFTEYSYNDNGYLTEQKVLTDKGADGSIGTSDDVIARTQLTYKNVAADDRDPTGVKDVSGKWKTGRTIPHVSLLETKTSPKGVATTTVTGDYQWTFTYDDANRNLIKVTEPEGSPRHTTEYAYNADGSVASITDARGTVTTDTSDFKTLFRNYDANGFPQEIQNALGKVTRFGYDDDGLLRWIQDAKHAAYSGGDPRTYRTYFDYDSFHRLGRQSTPKSSAQNLPLVWSAADYDANDNLLSEFAPEYGHEFTRGPETKMTYDAMDRMLTSSNPQAEITEFAYDAAGRVTRVTTPKGTATTATDQDHAVFYEYDPLDRVVREKRYDTQSATLQALIAHFCYDTPGDLRSVTAPNAKVELVDCSAPPRFTTKYDYDIAHRLRAEIDPLGRRSELTYDLNGNVDSTTNPLKDKTLFGYDQRDMLIKVTEPFMLDRNVTTLYRYDGVGNLVKEISPRAYDASSDKTTFSEFVTTYSYDGVNQLRTIELPAKASEQKTFVYRDYDSNGDLLSTTLPDAATSLGAVPTSKTTTLTNFDTGWVESTNDHVNPKVFFDYNARGQQTKRTPEAGTTESWSYASDGMVEEHRDKQGQPVLYSYDLNNNLAGVRERSGVAAPGQKPIEIEVRYDTLDRIAKVRHRNENDQDKNYTFSTFSYDFNDNLIERGEDGIESETESLVRAPKRHTFAYDDADWLTTQLDYLDSGCQKVDNTFTSLGLEGTRVISKAAERCDASPSFSVKQSAVWDYFKNGKLKSVKTRNGPIATGTLVESHDVDYLDGGIYVNGHRTKDTFFKQGPATAAPCRSAAPCTATYTYDGRDRLIREYKGHGTPTDYTLDPAGNIIKEVTGTDSLFYTYAGNRLEKIAVGSETNVVAKHLYDREGNLDCVVAPTYTGACNSATASDLIKDYAYDYLNRLIGFQSYSSGAKTDEASYVYDPLDRVAQETESHEVNTTTPKKRTTDFTYLGLSNLVTKESYTGAAKSQDKSFTYDVYGNRISMTDDPAGTEAPKTYTYTYDVHGSVSLLLDSAGQAKASYGYDAYGDKDGPVTSGDTDDKDPLNPYRFSAKRFDSGSGTVDMGARRFGADTGRFLQQDLYGGALDDLDLTLDPLTQNRYALAAGNPISFMEWDGHRLMTAGSGGASKDPTRKHRGGRSSGGGGGGSRRLYTQAREGNRPAAQTFREAEKATRRLMHSATWGDYPEAVTGIAKPAARGRGGSALLKICEFAGACAVIDAVAERDWMRAGFELAMMWPIARAGKLAKLAKLGERADDVANGTRAVGFAPGEGISALPLTRLQHATRHLSEAGVLPVWRGATSPGVVRRALTPILERPTATFDAVLRGTRVKGFLGEINGQQVAALIYKEGMYQGQIATSFVPSPKQLAGWGF